MISLIKNELTKIFHKKAIYIVLIITLAFTVLGCVLEKVFSNDENFMFGDVDSIKQSMESLDKNNPEDLEIYYSLSAEVEMIKLANNYKKGSWQRYIIYKNAQGIIQDKIKHANTEDSEYYDSIYANFVKNLNNNDWKTFTQEELNSVNTEIASIESQSESEIEYQENNLLSLKDQRQALEWRLEKDICYDNSAKSKALDEYANSKSQLRDLKNREHIQKLNYEEKRSIQQLEADIKLYEYAIENNIDSKFEQNGLNDQTVLSSSADTNLVSTHYSLSMFIVIAVVIIAGTIVSEESNKGTIKLLLVRPYKRIKILFAKYISCLITLLVVLVATAIFQAIVGGFAYGFNNYLGKLIIYNFKTGNVETIGTISYMLLTALATLPQILLLLTLAFALSTVFNNSPVAIAIPLLGTMVAEIINQLFLIYKKAQFLKYFVTPNWDFRYYLFGKLPLYENLTFGFSFAICLAYFIVMIVASVLVFKKRDIKNV